MNDEVILNVVGDKELIEKNRQRGVTFPVRLSNYSTRKILTTTGPADKNGSYSIERTFEDSVSYAEDAEGDRINIPRSTDRMVGVSVRGTKDRNGNIKVSDIEGGDIDDNTKQLLKRMFESMANIEPMPKHSLKIGDTFSNGTSFDMPVPGQAPLKVNSESDYVLKKIEDNKAYFDIKMRFSLANNTDKFSIQSSGNGFGAMTYNLQDRLEEKSSTEISFKVEIKDGSKTFSSSMRSTGTTEQYLVNKDKKHDKTRKPAATSTSNSPAS
ncbi:MAG: hypothetical protein Tsb0026_01870 [Sulfuricaulis sp.]